MSFASRTPEYGGHFWLHGGRKVDTSIRIRVDNQWRTEKTIFEFKSSTVGPRDMPQAAEEVRALECVHLAGAFDSRGMNINLS